MGVFHHFLGPASLAYELLFPWDFLCLLRAKMYKKIVQICKWVAVAEQPRKKRQSNPI